MFLTRCVNMCWLELEQAPVDPVIDPVQQHTSSDLQSSFPLTTATQPLASGVEVVLPLDPPSAGITLAPVPSQPAAAPPTVTDDESPTFTLGLENQTVTCGDAAVFTVLFSGRPRPAVRNG